MGKPAHTHHIRHYQQSRFEITLRIDPETQIELKSEDHSVVDKARKKICGTFNHECAKKYGVDWTKHFRFVTWRQLVITPLE